MPRSKAVPAHDPQSRYRLTSPVLLGPEVTVADSLWKKAYLQLKDQILSLRLQPGQFLNEPDLMKEMQVGRTPLREALNRLALESLVTVMPRRGTFVSDINLTDIGHIFEIRIQLEGFAARLAAERATSQEREGLLDLQAHHDELRSDFSQEEMARRDLRIHRHIHRCADNPFLADTLDHYSNLSVRMWFALRAQLSRIRGPAEHPAFEEHQRIIAALVAGDAESAQTWARRHVKRLQEDIHSIL